MLIKTLCCFLLCVFMPAFGAGMAQAQTLAGEIVFSSGAASVDGKPVGNNMQVMEGAQLRTGPGATLYLKTVDKGFLILRENSRATVAAYRIDPKEPQNSRFKIELEQGVARHISGDSVKQSRQNFRFNTPVAAIGVRGTDFTVFADKLTMRVTVSSGGIIVGALSGGCSLGGSGPCEGNASRELFAGDPNLVLQVSRGDALPQLLKSIELRPDAIAPPRADEPAAADAKPGQGRSNQSSSIKTGAVHSAQDLVSADLIEVATLRTLAPGPTVKPVPPVAVDPGAEPTSPRQVVWGRWAPVADAPREAVKLAMVRDPSYVPVSLVDAYFITRTAGDGFALPNAGKFDFRMLGGEAYVVDSNGFGGAAAIQNPKLEVDFVKREFATSLQVVQGTSSIDIRAQGDVTSQGELLSDAVRSNAVLRGALGGSTGQNAAYIFNRQLDNGLRAIGGTNWGR